MKRIYLLTVLVFLILPATMALAQEERPPFLMKAVFLEKGANPGDVVTLELRYSMPEGARLFEKPVIKGLESLTEMSTEFSSDRVILKILVDTIETLEVPPLSLPFYDINNEAQTLMSEPVKLSVTPAIEGEANALDIRAIKGIIPIERWHWHKWLPYVLGGLVLLVLFGVVWSIVRRRKRKEEDHFVEPPDSEALRALEYLEGSGLFEKGEVKAYYFSLSEILRRYMEKIRLFPANEWTTDEIAAFVDDEEDRNLVKLLRRADLIKFADTRPTVAQKNEHRAVAQSYVETTRNKREEETRKADLSERKKL